MSLRRARLAPTMVAILASSGCGEQAAPVQRDPLPADEAELDAAIARDATSPPAAEASVVEPREAGSVDARPSDGAIVDAAVADARPLDAALSDQSCAAPQAVPKAVRDRYALDAFYQKYVDAGGIPVLSSSKPDDRSLVLACQLLNGMLALRSDVRQAMITSRARFVIIGKDEGTAEVPEYGYRERSKADRDQINQRARGLGGQVASCGEENMLCLQGDRYYDESICLHELSHTISTYGVFSADKTFEQRLQAAYTSARDRGILDRTYRKENVQEYWAEGVQDWFDSNASASPPNGIHNQVDTRDELKGFDPTLYALIGEVFPTFLAWMDCHADK